MKKTKLLLLMLTLALAVTCCLSLTAFAEDGEDSVAIRVYNASGEEVGNGYADWNTAYEDVQNGYTMELQKNLDVPANNQYAGDVDKSILKGAYAGVKIEKTFTLTSAANNTYTIRPLQSDNAKAFFCLNGNDANLTLKNIIVDQDSINSPEGTTSTTYSAFRTINGNAKITVGEGAEIRGGKAVNVDVGGATVTLNGGKIVLSKSVEQTQDCTIELKSGTIDASGCTGAAAIIVNDKMTLNISDGVTFTGGAYADVLSTGGSVENKNNKLHKTDKVVSGSTIYAYGDKKIAVKATVGTVNTAYCYTDLETAMDAAASGSTIYFLDDVEFVGKTDGNVGNKKAKVYVMDKDAVKSIVLDAMKHKLTFGEWTDDEGSKLSSTIKVTHDSSVLTIKNATLIRTVGETPVVYLVPGQLNIQDSAVTLAGSYNGESALCWITNGEYARINIKNTKITECKSTSENDPNACLIRLDTGSVRLTECEVINNEMMLVRTNKKSGNYIAGYNAVIELNDTKINDNKIKTQNGGMICEQTWDGRQGDVSVYVNGNTVVKDNLTSTESVRNIDVSTGTNNGIIIGDNFTGSIGVYAGDRTSFGTASEVPSVESIKNDASATGQFARADGGKLVWTDKPTLKVETDLGKYETVTPATEEGGDETTTITHVLRVVTTNTNENTTPITKFGTYFVNTEDGTITTTNSYTGEKESADFGKGNGWVVDMVGDSSKSGNTGTVCAVSFYYVSGVTDPVTDVTTVEYDFTTAKTITEDQVITNDSDANAGGLGE